MNIIKNISRTFNKFYGRFPTSAEIHYCVRKGGIILATMDEIEAIEDEMSSAEYKRRFRKYKHEDLFYKDNLDDLVRRHDVKCKCGKC
jgi:hypothetical protein